MFLHSSSWSLESWEGRVPTQRPGQQVERKRAEAQRSRQEVWFFCFFKDIFRETSDLKRDDASSKKHI